MSEAKSTTPYFYNVWEAAKTKQSTSIHTYFWYPDRCELEGCEVKRGEEPLKMCSACKMVKYCCVDHQKADWKHHKQDCRCFKRINARAVFYTDSEMLSRFPLSEAAADEGAPAPAEDDWAAQRMTHRIVPNADKVYADKCGICGVGHEEKATIPTHCCGLPVCDSAGEYQMFSYSRKHCPRSHDRYTLCGYHLQEDGCDKGDWRTCRQCVKGGDNAMHSVPDVLWRGLNNYNHCPMLMDDVPRHSMCNTCAQCQTRFHSGLEGMAYNHVGVVCHDCGNNPPPRESRDGPGPGGVTLSRVGNDAPSPATPAVAMGGEGAFDPRAYDSIEEMMEGQNNYNHRIMWNKKIKGVFGDGSPIQTLNHGIISNPVGPCAITDDDGMPLVSMPEFFPDSESLEDAMKRCVPADSEEGKAIIAFWRQKTGSKNKSKKKQIPYTPASQSSNRERKKKAKESNNKGKGRSRSKNRRK
jgi:hypothetical protein